MRMRGNTILTMIILLCTGIINAQDTKHFFQVTEQNPTTCGSDIIHQRMLLEDEGYRREFEEQSQLLRNSIDMGGEDAAKSMMVYTIPVVVHVMHTGQSAGTGINISDSQIQSAIDGMNEDFRKMPGTNGDGDGVDVEIEVFVQKIQAPHHI